MPCEGVWGVEEGEGKEKECGQDREAGWSMKSSEVVVGECKVRGLGDRGKRRKDRIRKEGEERHILVMDVMKRLHRKGKWQGE